MTQTYIGGVILVPKFLAVADLVYLFQYFLYWMKMKC